ncbi:MAG: methyltransferase domain-containing protein [Clostridia bacterium]|nr:methyltransferase domain-containing protein [Clostridia bacterium]
MKYPKSEKYMGNDYMKYIMGPNPLKLCEELLAEHRIPAGARVMDLGSGEGLTSAFLAKEYGFTVYAADLWSEPETHYPLFENFGLTREQCIPVKADANDLPFEREFFDSVVCVDSYNYFGRDPAYLDEKLLPFVKSGGMIYAAVTGMKKDCHDNIPEVLLRSWNAEQLDYIHDAQWWRNMVSQSRDCEVVSVHEMQSNAEVWADWLRQDNEYAVGDRATMEHGGLDYMNFVAIVLRKK